MIDFNFNFKSNVFFGSGSRKKIEQIAIDNNYKVACIVIDHALLSVPIINDFLNSLIFKEKVLIECDISEPTYDKLEQKRDEINKNNIDVFIGIGGGSALDMTKGLSVLYSNDKPAIDYRGFDKFKNKIPPIIGIPTTAGTGSEITPNASFIDLNEKKKLGINGEAIRPKYAILDPELTSSCPLKPTISAAVDSLVHATEAFVAQKSNPMAKIFSHKGFKLVFENLPILIKDLENIELREKVMYGAFLSAIALMNSGTGPAAAMSYPLGVHYGVPHGIGGAIFLPHVIQYNIDQGFLDYGNLYCSNKEITKKKDKAKLFIDDLNKIWSILNVPSEIASFGVNNKKIDSFINDTMELKGALDQNPVPFYNEEILRVLKKLIIN